MSAAILELKAIEGLVDKKGRDRVRHLSTLLDELGQMLHRIAWELRPASLDELGLTTALENYVVEWGHKHAIQADFHCSDLRLDKRSNEIRTTVYRVIQEGLTNVAKHAGNATKAVKGFYSAASDFSRSGRPRRSQTCSSASAS